MKEITNLQEWDNLLLAQTDLSPDPDFSNEKYISEDYWDKNHDKVVAFVNYYNTGDIKRYITEN